LALEPSRLVLTSGEVAIALGYLHRDGRPDRGKVYRFARDGRIPPPIEPTVHQIDWRWSATTIEQALTNEFPPEVLDALRTFMALHGPDATLAQLRDQRLVRKTVSPALRSRILERDGRVCRYCGRTIGPRSKFHLDHVKPASAGGETTEENLVVSCIPCNSSKANSNGETCGGCGHLTWTGNERAHLRHRSCGGW
jgi:hypothetical protein